MSMSDFKLIDFGAKHMPERIHPEDAGMDIYAPTTFHVPPQESVYVSCGFGILMPPGYMAYTVVRGSTANMGLHIAENPIDAGYTGEVHAVVWNISNDTVVIQEGERFCQLVIVPCVTSARDAAYSVPRKLPTIKPEEASDYGHRGRGSGGYGSTNGTGTPYIIPCSSVCGGGGAETGTLYGQDDQVVERVRADPLDRASEVVSLKVIGKPTINSAPFAHDRGLSDITSQYDPEKHSVTVRCWADVVTLGITVKVLQRLYMDACRGLPVDVSSRIHKVIEEVCDSGQN